MGSPIAIRIILPYTFKLKTMMRQLVVAAHGDGRGVHHAQIFGQDLGVADVGEAHRVGVIRSGSLS